VQPLFGNQNLNFRVITLYEPPKHILATYLDAEQREDSTQRPIRTARVEVIVKNKANSNDLLELLVDLDSSSVTKQHHLEGKHSYIDSSYMKDVEEACLANPEVQGEIEKLELPPQSSVIVEPWAYATDGSNDMSRRITMVRSLPNLSTKRTTTKTR
jgi:primary-amine oxidase